MKPNFYSVGLIREHRTDADLFHAISHPTISDVILPRPEDLQTRSASPRHGGRFRAPVRTRLMVLEIVGEHYRKAGEIGRAFRYLVQAAKRKADRCMVQEVWRPPRGQGDSKRPRPPSSTRRRTAPLRRDLLSVRASVFDSRRGAWDDAAKGWLAVLGIAEEDRDPETACAARLELAQVLRRKEIMPHLDATRSKPSSPHGSSMTTTRSAHRCTIWRRSLGLPARARTVRDSRKKGSSSPTVRPWRACAPNSPWQGPPHRRSKVRSSCHRRPDRGRGDLPRTPVAATAMPDAVQLVRTAAVAGGATRGVATRKAGGPTCTETDYRLGLTASLRALAAAYLELGQYPEADKCLRTGVNLAQRPVFTKSRWPASR